MVNKIKLLAMDVDGTMTDGNIYISDNGELFKSFSVKDGMGIKIAHDSDIRTAIITGRESAIVTYRARELGITDVYQSIVDKSTVIRELMKKYQLNKDEVAYVGDDINDIPVFSIVGLSFTPSDAVPEAKKKADVVLQSAGGQGAIRECVEYILSDNAK